MFLLQTNNALEWINEHLSLFSSFISLVGAYFILRERIVKMEIKNAHITEYIDSHISMLKNDLNNVKEDINDFKQLNKETAKSLIDNTAAIKELKLVLDMISRQINRDLDK